LSIGPQVGDVCFYFGRLFGRKYTAILIAKKTKEELGRVENKRKEGAWQSGNPAVKMHQLQ
jgi:hypothetical protein